MEISGWLEAARRIPGRGTSKEVVEMLRVGLPDLRISVMRSVAEGVRRWLRGEDGRGVMIAFDEDINDEAEECMRRSVWRSCDDVSSSPSLGGGDGQGEWTRRQLGSSSWLECPSSSS